MKKKNLFVVVGTVIVAGVAVIIHRLNKEEMINECVNCAGCDIKCDGSECANTNHYCNIARKEHILDM